MASIESYETSKGIRYQVRYRQPGGGSTKKRGFRRKIDARKWAEQKESSKNEGAFIKESAGLITIGELANAWLAKKKVSSKESHYHNLEVSWKAHVKPRWADRQVKSIGRGEVQSWVAKLSETKSASVVLRANGILAGILDDAKRDRLIADNPARGLELPRKKRRQHTYLTAAQLFAISDACTSGEGHHAGKDDYQHSVLILVLGIVGLRWGEAIGLRIRDIDFKRHRLNVNVSATQVDGRIVEGTPKSGKSRSVVFPQALEQPLKQLSGERPGDSLLFTGTLDGYMRQPQPKGHSWYASAVRRAGLREMTVHDLRHTSASLMVHSGANVKAVQRQLGHASAAMTLDVYADLFDDDLDAVGMAMDEIILRSVPKMCPKTVSEAA
jgi:integrase